MCKGYITKVVWRAILALMGAWGPHKLVISDNIVYTLPILQSMDLVYEL